MANRKGRHVEAERMKRHAEYLKAKKQAKKETKMKFFTLKKKK